MLAALRCSSRACARFAPRPPAAEEEEEEEEKEEARLLSVCAVASTKMCTFSPAWVCRGLLWLWLLTNKKQGESKKKNKLTRTLLSFVTL